MVMKEQVYECLRTIPQGKVVTYGQIAEYLGKYIMSLELKQSESVFIK